jgi:predicted MFS family arabinose efflux permease
MSARRANPMRVAAAGLVALAVAMGIGRFAFTPILPMMQEDAGLSVAHGGWLASANYGGYLLGAVSATRFRIRPATAIRGGLLTIGFATLGMGLGQGFAGWLALRALAGIASAWVLIFVSAWALEKLASVRRPVLGSTVFAGVGTGIAVAGFACIALMDSEASSAQAWAAFGLLSLGLAIIVWPVFGADDRAPSGEPRSVLLERSHRREAGSLGPVLCYGAFGFGYIIPATFLPVMARDAVADPSVFGWAWPLFGIAAALSTLAASGLQRLVGNRRLWIFGHLVMALGVALPVVWSGVAGIALAALCVGGTFMVVTMAAMQEARLVARDRARDLMAAMTSAFAVGQIAGPISVSYLAAAPEGFAQALLLASALLVASAGVLAWQTKERSQ